MFLLIDFAETLAFRPKPELESDIGFISESAGVARDKVVGGYKRFCEKKKWFGQFPKYYSSIEEEVADYVSHFQWFRDYSQIELDADRIALRKIYENQHQLFSDAESFMKRARSVFKWITIVSEGRPSRNQNIINLGLGEYINQSIISDIEGVPKHVILQNIDDYLGMKANDEGMVLVDDQLKYAKSCDHRISFFLINRSGATTIKSRTKRLGALDEIFEHCNIPA